MYLPPPSLWVLPGPGTPLWVPISTRSTHASTGVRFSIGPRGFLLLRPAALAAQPDLIIDEWPYLDSEVLVETRSRKVCMTQASRWSELHPRAHLPAAPGCLIAHGEHITIHCQGWSDDMTHSQGWTPEVAYAANEYV